MSKTVFVDVDGTLLLWPGPKQGRMPRVGEDGYGQSPRVNTRLVQRLHDMHAQGWQIVVWSAGGRDHADFAVKTCEIEKIVKQTVSKPNLLIDDSEDFLERRLRKGAISVEGPFDG